MEKKYIQIIESLKNYANEIHTHCERLFLKIEILELSKSIYAKNTTFLDSYMENLEQFKEGYKTLINLPRPQNSFFLDIEIDKKLYNNNPILIEKIHKFEILYKEQENRISTNFGKIIEEIGASNEVVPYYIPTHQDKINLDKHFAVLTHMNDLKSQGTCKMHSIGDDPIVLYYMLPIRYKDIIDDTAGYETISCCVLLILQEHRNLLLKIVSNLDYMPIESENFPLVISPVIENQVLSDNSVEGITWVVRYSDSSIPFAVMKYGKENKGEPKSYNIIHELAIGMVLNTIRNITPNFMYIWGAFSCSPPQINGVNPDTTSETKNIYNYQSLCSNTDPKSMEIIMLTEYVDAKYTFFSFVLDDSIPNYSKHLIDLMIQIMCSITIAQTLFRFVHGDLHDRNILIKKLSYPVTLTYVISELDSSEPFTVTLKNVLYIAVIIDYGFSTMVTTNGVRLNPLQNAFFNDENPFSPMSDMSMAFETLWASKHILLLIDLTKLITTDYSGSMYKVTRNFYNIIQDPSTDISLAYNSPKCKQMGGFRDFTCMELPLLNIKYIIGPCSFHYFKYGSRNIYLFGEHHEPLERSGKLIAETQNMTESNTIMFAGFVHSLATQNPSKTYDLMFESSYFLNKKDNEVSYGDSPTINSITETFLPCIKSATRKGCEYKNLRTHYIDFRRSDEVDQQYTQVDKINPYLKRDVHSLITSGKILKQINAIKDVRNREALLQYTNHFLKGTFEEQFKPIIIMDIYGIARLLREFDPKINKGNTQFKGTSENIIYYAGALHIKQMVHFFTNYIHLAQSSINKQYIQQSCESFIKLNVAEKSLNFV